VCPRRHKEPISSSDPILSGKNKAVAAPQAKARALARKAQANLRQGQNQVRRYPREQAPPAEHAKGIDERPAGERSDAALSSFHPVRQRFARVPRLQNSPSHSMGGESSRGPRLLCLH
jgi:hypothetical protein